MAHIDQLPTVIGDLSDVSVVAMERLFEKVAATEDDRREADLARTLAGCMRDEQKRRKHEIRDLDRAVRGLCTETSWTAPD